MYYDTIRLVYPVSMSHNCDIVRHRDCALLGCWQHSRFSNCQASGRVCAYSALAQKDENVAHTKIQREKRIMENFAKSKGRPTAISAETAAIYRALNPQLTDRRSLLNWHYTCRAYNAVRKIPELEWLAELRSNGEFRRTTILQELGRITDDRLFAYTAFYLCEHKPKTKDALSYIKKVRPGDTRQQADSLELISFIGNAIEKYDKAHKGLTFDMVLDSLEVLWLFVKGQRDSQPSGWRTHCPKGKNDV